MHPFLNALLDFIFPPLCHICKVFIPDAGALHICPACRDKLKMASSPLCRICGIPFTGQGDDHACGKCLGKQPAFDIARAAVIHEGDVRHLIHAFKYNNKTHLRRPLALLTIERLTDFIRQEKPELILPVPLHIDRLRKRGFNQAILLGEMLSREWKIPMERRALLRLRRTEPQVDLSAAERLENVKNAFGVSETASLAGKAILLLDDVLTTGSTVDECARILKKAGVTRVTVVTVARAVNH